MAKVFKSFVSDVIGEKPASTSLKRNSVAGDYQVVDEVGVKELRFGRSGGTQTARGLAYDGVLSSGALELFAKIREPGVTAPASARLIAFATDSPENEYGAYFNAPNNRVEIYRRVAGSFTMLASVNFGATTEYYQILFQVIPGIPPEPNTLRVKRWDPPNAEPTTWGAEVTDGSFDLISGSQVGGWAGHVGFDDTPFIYFTEVGIGTDGDSAPREPVSGSITLSVDSISLSMAMDSATLTQANQLIVDDLQCQTSIDAVTLQQANVISPDEITLTSQIDSAVLVSAGQLSVNDLQLTMAMQATQLQQANQLSVDSLLLSTTFDSPDLSVGLTLVPDSIWLSAMLDQVALTQSHLLTVDDLTQSISLDNVTLTVAGQVIGPGTLTIGITGPSISIGISP